MENNKIIQLQQIHSLTQKVEEHQQCLQTIQKLKEQIEHQNQVEMQLQQVIKQIGQMDQKNSNITEFINNQLKQQSEQLRIIGSNQKSARCSRNNSHDSHQWRETVSNNQVEQNIYQQQKVECMKCNREFDQNMINEHIDNCSHEQFSYDEIIQPQPQISFKQQNLTHINNSQSNPNLHNNSFLSNNKSTLMLQTYLGNNRRQNTTNGFTVEENEKENINVNMNRKGNYDDNEIYYGLQQKQK